LEDRCLQAESVLADERDRACEERQSVRDSMGHLVQAKEALEREVEQLVKKVIAGGTTHAYNHGDTGYNKRASTLDLIGSTRKDVEEMTEVLRDFQPLLGNLLRQVTT
jgi:hypothetical protein